jgi:stress response protein YsnF
MSGTAILANPFFETALAVQRSYTDLFLKSVFSPFDALTSASRMRPSTSRSLVKVEGTAERVIPIGEEYLNVNKQVVPGETVRVVRSVVESPVEEQVELVTETVVVERRRASGLPSGQVLTETTTEMTSTSERPVVTKGVRTVEEVVLRKQATTHRETIRDTLRRDHVEVREPSRMPAVVASPQRRDESGKQDSGKPKANA